MIYRSAISVLVISGEEHTYESDTLGYRRRKDDLNHRQVLYCLCMSSFVIQLIRYTTSCSRYKIDDLSYIIGCGASLDAVTVS